MKKSTETHIVKRVQKASDGKYAYIVRKIVGQDYCLGRTYIFFEDLLNEEFGTNIYDSLAVLMPELDGQPDNLKAFKVTTTIEEVSASELFTPVGAEEEK